VDASGKAIPGGGAAAQSFVRLCETNWPSGPDYGNPGIHDILKLYLPSLEACITACASYNFNYEANRAKGIGSQEGGLCRAVSIVKSGEYFFYFLFFFFSLLRFYRCGLGEMVMADCRW